VRGRAWLLTIALVGIATWADVAAAQISPNFLDQWGLNFEFSRTSARRDALAGITVPIEDETSEINMWDYGRNVAGFLFDRDAWSGDFWASSRNLDRTSAGSGQSGRMVESGIQLAFRSRADDRALGLEGNLTSVEDQDPSRGEKHEFSGPVLGAVANQRIGESLVLGLGVVYLSEDEKVVSNDPLAVQHSTRRTDWRFGLVYYLGTKLDLGLTFTYANNRITGLSVDGFHRDKYDWDRPITELGAQIVYGDQSNLQGGIFGKYRILNGGEIMRLSWSREFFLNPSGVDLSLDVPLVNEKLRTAEAGTRWLWKVFKALNLGVSGQYLSGTYEAEVNPTFPSFVEAADQEFEALHASGGVAIWLTQRFGLYGQADALEETLDEVVQEGIQKTTRTSLGARLGLEWFWRPEIAVRLGGHLRQVRDEFEGVTDVSKVEYDELVYTGGLGWAPGGGLVQLDAAIGFTDRSAKEPEDLTDTTDGYAISLTARTLFQ